MSTVDGPDAGIGHTPQQVRQLAAAELRQVMAAGQVAMAMSRLVLADRSRHRAAPVELGHLPDGVLPRLAAQAARAVVDASRQRPPRVYPAAADAAAGDADLGALAWPSWPGYICGWATRATAAGWCSWSRPTSGRASRCGGYRPRSGAGPACTSSVNTASAPTTHG